MRAVNAAGLTDKQEKFAQHVAEGKSQHEAYKTAYNCKTMSRKCIDENASRLMANSKVSARVSQLKRIVDFVATQRMAESVIWTRQMSIDGLCSIFKDPEAPHSARVAALKEINAMHGYNEATKINLGGQKDNPILIAPDEANL
jgi:hypothetical protein